MSIFTELKDRGFVYQTTDLDRLRDMLEGERKVTFYLGIDPTADSLHIGHFFALMMFRRLQRAGHRGIIVIGGATALIGDPSGKSDMRRMLSREEVDHNLEEVKGLVRRFVSTEGDNPAIILDNSEWINNETYVDFMRKVGIHFNISTMLACDAYRSRLDKGGLTFLEMGYMLMQAYDFTVLNERYGCTLEIGGSDQWANIIAGINLHRKFHLHDISGNGDELVGLTCPLLMSRDGRKMGKTEKGALWIESDRTTVLDFYQYFYNVDDDDVPMLLRLFTDISTERIDALISGDILTAKRTMAFEITRLVHGDESAEKLVASLTGMKTGNSEFSGIPSVEIEEENLGDSIDIIDFVALTGLTESKSEARRLIQQKGIKVNGSTVSITDSVALSDFKDGKLILAKGKKVFVNVVLKS